jgi:hypothetical protein
MIVVTCRQHYAWFSSVRHIADMVSCSWVDTTLRSVMRRNEVGLAGSVTALRREGQLLDTKHLTCFFECRLVETCLGVFSEVQCRLVVGFHKLSLSNCGQENRNRFKVK